MDSRSLFKQEELKQREYESITQHMSEQNQTDVAYSALNSRYLNAFDKYQKDEYLKERDDIYYHHNPEEQTALENKWKKTFIETAKARKEKKKQIETAWHQNTEKQKKELEKRKGRGSAKEASYYANYSLKELEVFIKSSDRGGNSQEYNDVATDLEVYNRVMSNEMSEANEGITLLKRLQDSCNTYLAKRKKTFWRSSKGKIRRAIIESISIKVNETLTRQTTKIMEESTKAKTEYESESTEENINQAVKANYDLMYQVFNGAIQLTDEQTKQLEKDMIQMLKKLRECKVDENQGDNLATRFFNALGWSSGKARIVKDLGDEELKKSPLKRKMFHSMNSFTKTIPANPQTGEPEKKLEITAIDMAHQLAGTKEKNNRIFYGLGRFGKGIYTSTSNDNEDSSDQFAYNNSWGYGDQKGAAMVIMTLNENARVARYEEAKRCMKIFEDKFPELAQTIRQLEKNDKSEDYLTIFASFFGYNTIKGNSGINAKGIPFFNGAKDDVDYYTTTNRKALSISDTVEIRKETKTDRDEVMNYDMVDYYSLLKHTYT